MSKEKIARRVAERNGWSSYSKITARMLVKMLWHRRKMTKIPSQNEIDKIFPIAKVDWNILRNPSTEHIQSTWIGHASCFVQMGGFNIITDPVFSTRCSPSQFMGPERYRDPAFSINDICASENVGIDVALISHNHYDHLDYHSVRELASTAIKMDRPLYFIVPLGLKKWFANYVPKSLEGRNKLVELDWHENYTIEGKNDNKLEITGIPMQHWSNRYGYDRDKSLWCGFGIRSKTSTSSLNYLFSGDTGLFDGLNDIGESYGPFDLAAIPIGAYTPRWFMRTMHTDPDDAVKMMDAIKAKKAFPIHWGTFPLTAEHILEPRELLEEAMASAGKDLSTFQASLIGETIMS